MEDGRSRVAEEEVEVTAEGGAEEGEARAARGRQVAGGMAVEDIPAVDYSTLIN